jgi:hypothetical protein
MPENTRTPVRQVVFRGIGRSDPSASLPSDQSIFKRLLILSVISSADAGFGR